MPISCKDWELKYKLRIKSKENRGIRRKGLTYTNSRCKDHVYLEQFQSERK